VNGWGVHIHIHVEVVRLRNKIKNIMRFNKKEKMWNNSLVLQYKRIKKNT